MVPTDCTQLDWPSQVVLQPLSQVPVQVVLASQCEVQFEVQSTLQVFMCWQSRVTSDGAVVVDPPSPATNMPLSTSKVSPVPPMLQVPPLSQVQVESLQAQAPTQLALTARSEQPATRVPINKRMRMLDLRAPRALDTCDEVG
jgi:hypothetical protein